MMLLVLVEEEEMSHDSIYAEWDDGIVYRHKTLPYTCRVIRKGNFLIFSSGKMAGEWDEPCLLTCAGGFHITLLDFIMEVRNLERDKED